MPSCRMCKQNYPNSQFVNGIGPLSLVCVRCATENDMLAEEKTTTLYSDELAKERSTLFARRYRAWAFLVAGWLLYLTLGAGIELWSNIFLTILILGTLSTPVLHFLNTTKFQAELAKLTP